MKTRKKVQIATGCADLAFRSPEYDPALVGYITSGHLGVHKAPAYSYRLYKKSLMESDLDTVQKMDKLDKFFSKGPDECFASMFPLIVEKDKSEVLSLKDKLPGMKFMPHLDDAIIGVGYLEHELRAVVYDMILTMEIAHKLGHADKIADGSVFSYSYGKHTPWFLTSLDNAHD